MAEWISARYTKRMPRPSSYPLRHELGIIALSVCIAFILAYTNALEQLLRSAEGIEGLGSFIAGILYTSIFTSVPAAVALGKIALLHSPFATAFIGGVGALIGDLFVFRFVRDSVSPYLGALIHAAHAEWLRKAFSRHPLLRALPMILGFIIIASPLPDEPGIILLGLTKTKTALFAPISFLANFLGILAIGLAAQSLAN